MRWSCEDERERERECERERESESEGEGKGDAPAVVEAVVESYRLVYWCGVSVEVLRERARR